MSLRNPKTQEEALRRFRYWWPLRKICDLQTGRSWFATQPSRQQLRGLIQAIRDFRESGKNPEKVEMGKRSQAKGRHAPHGERGVIRRWLKMGYKRTDILDRKEFECSAQELGIDLVHVRWGITLQNKNFGPKPPALRKTATDEWDKLEHMTFKRFPELIPVMFWRNSKDEDHPTREYAIQRREDFEARAHELEVVKKRVADLEALLE